MFVLSGTFLTDIITNSSSVVYSAASSVGSLQSLLDEILAAVGVNKTAAELFNISIILDGLEYADEKIDDFYELAGLDEGGQYRACYGATIPGAIKKAYESRIAP